jgi:nitroreductase
MQNETLTVIHRRRSIRNYKPEQIGDVELHAIIEAAIYAPTGMNLQGWHFSVVQNPELLARLRRTMKENMLNSGVPAMVERASAPDYSALHNAPTIIFLSADKYSRYAQIDCGLAAENICLAAESLNIGSCVLTSSANLFLADKSSALGHELGFPAGFVHVCSVTLGYKNEDPAPKDRNADLVTYIK